MVAGALLFCASGLRSGRIPASDAGGFWTPTREEVHEYEFCFHGLAAA
jgi:hypothetical protein